MNIGEPKKEYTVVPTEIPVPDKEPERKTEPEKEVVEEPDG